MRCLTRTRTRTRTRTPNPNRNPNPNPNSGTWGLEIDEYERRLGARPERLNNLHFAYLTVALLTMALLTMALLTMAQQPALCLLDGIA